MPFRRPSREYRDVRPPVNAQAASYDFLNPPQAADEMGRLGPYRILRVLAATVPIAGTVLGAAAHELHGQLQHDVEQTRKLLDHHLPDHLAALDDRLA